MTKANKHTVNFYNNSEISEEYTQRILGRKIDWLLNDLRRAVAVSESNPSTVMVVSETLRNHLDLCERHGVSTHKKLPSLVQELKRLEDKQVFIQKAWCRQAYLYCPTDVFLLLSLPAKAKNGARIKPAIPFIGVLGRKKIFSNYLRKQAFARLALPNIAIVLGMLGSRQLPQSSASAYFST